MGELACFIGLKLKIAERILFEIDWRVRRSVPRQFSVALINTASLPPYYQTGLLMLNSDVRHAYLVSSLKTLRSRSNSPDASGSRLGGGISG